MWVSKKMLVAKNGVKKFVPENDLFTQKKLVPEDIITVNVKKTSI